ncbi:netrin-1 [Lepeophtheirus salmonis]|uniref:netrin-1 n=1 Tax=Lepeophtheirus salmonis TaxID=72036 RepID=UPI001AEA476A|nr:netrin-1-like [Lepeophtheirus salmonis]
MTLFVHLVINLLLLSVCVRSSLGRRFGDSKLLLPYSKKSSSSSSSSLLLLDESGSFSSSSSSKRDPCYDDKKKRPVSCIPDFVNAAFGLPVDASSTCGGSPTEICDSDKCHTCDSSHKENSHPPEFLTDLHNPSNVTCWKSDLLDDSTNASLTVSLKKKFELTYISLHFCGPKPTSMIIFKSMDHRKSWQPFQYYAEDCRTTFKKNSKVPITRANEQEALCVSSYMKTDSTRIAFSTLADRPSSEDFEHSPVLQDWVTATDIKIVFPPNPLVSGDVAIEESLIPSSTQVNQTSLPSRWVGVSDLAVGGRCKCNGHASSCSIEKDGEMTCNCQHNTAGRECEKCKSFHFDRPWGRATSHSANECVACKCNQHARRCRFNMELYQLSGGVSGGVCLKCRHNTAGRHCHYCKEGYYRNSKRDISHKKACEPCNCHPVGASGKICNQTNGQCPCKDGVTGVECNRCKEGYQQSGSPIAPCIKVPRSHHNRLSSSKSGSSAYENPARDDECATCTSTSKRVQMRRYCKMDSVYLITVSDRDRADSKWSRFSILVEKRYKKSKKRNRNNHFRRGEETYLWVKTKHLRCRCPKIRPNTSYLILNEDPDEDAGDKKGKRGLIISKNTLVIEWKREWRRRMKRFKKRSRKYCNQ